MAISKTRVKVWKTFCQEKPPLGSTVIVQTGCYKPFEVTLEAGEHCSGHGHDYPCFIEVPNVGPVHISQFIWRQPN